MDEKTLTTETNENESNVNTDATESSTEDIVDIKQEEEVSELSQSDDKSNDNDAYEEAWNNVDLNNTDMFNQEETTTVDDETQEVVEETVVENIDETIDKSFNAFMDKSPVLKFKGKEIPIDSPDELIALAQKGFKLETEMSKIKPKKRILSIVENIPEDVLQAVKDLHEGNKSALAYLKSSYKIQDDVQESSFDDLFAEESEQVDYKPEVKNLDPVEEYWKGYLESDPSGAGKVSEVTKSLPEEFLSEVYTETMFPVFVNTVVSGEFDNVFPYAMKEKTLQPTLTWLQAYQLGAKRLSSKDEVTKKQEPTNAVSANRTSKTVPNDRNISSTAKYDRVWDDESLYQEMQKEIFAYN